MGLEALTVEARAVGALQFKVSLAWPELKSFCNVCVGICLCVHMQEMSRPNKSSLHRSYSTKRLLTLFLK